MFKRQNFKYLNFIAVQSSNLGDNDFDQIFSINKFVRRIRGFFQIETAMKDLTLFSKY